MRSASLTAVFVVAGIFALFLAVVEAAALPLFKRLMESHRRTTNDNGT